MQARRIFLGNGYALLRQDAFPLHNALNLCTILNLRIWVRELQIIFSIFFCFMVTTDTSGSVRAESGSKYCLVLNIWSFEFHEHFMVCAAQIIDLNERELRLSFSLLAHLIRRFKRAFLITCFPSSVRLSLNLSYFLTSSLNLCQI